MKKTFRLKSIIFISLFALVLSGCTSAGSKSPASDDSSSDKGSANLRTVEITDVYGKVTVPVNPKKVVALDNRTFETLADWGVELAAVPKGIMPADSPYVADDSVLDIGTHNDPNLEMIAAVDPELVIVGQRFASHYEEIEALVPNATVINLDIDISAKVGSPGDNLINGLKDATRSLGLIFDKTADAEQLILDFDKAIADARSAYNGSDTVISVVVSGGEIGYSAPGLGRVWGPMYEIFNWKSALEVAGTTSDHQGDDISVEAIAQSNPDWIFVLDRDAATSSAADQVPAQDVIDRSPALQNTRAVTQGQILYAPKDTYVNESIQTYLELFENFASALA